MTFATRHLRLAFGVLVLALALPAFTGCGGGGEDPKKLLRETFSGEHDVKSGKLNLSLDVNAKGVPNLQQPVSVKVSGPFASQGEKKLPRFDFSLTFSGGGQNLSAGAVSTGDKGFVKFQNQAYAVPDDLFTQFKQGFEQAQSQGGKQDQGNLKKLGLDPLNWLKNPKTEGDEDVGGASTKHIRSDIDVPRFLDDVNKVLSNVGSQDPGASQVPSSISPQQKQRLVSAIKKAQLDVYTGEDDHALRRLTVALSVQSGQGSGEVSFNVEIGDLNEEQDIKAPPNPRDFEELQKQLGALGSLGGGAGSAPGGAAPPGGTGAPGATTPGATTPGATAPKGGAAPPASGSKAPGGNDQRVEKYTECLSQAGDDARKAQKCADLLR